MSFTFSGNGNNNRSNIMGQIVPVPSVDPNGGLNINLLGDVTIVNHQQLGPMGNPYGFAQQQMIGAMKQMIGTQQQLMQLEYNKLRVEEQKIKLATQAMMLNSPNKNADTKVLVDNGDDSDRLLPQRLRSKLISEDAECVTVSPEVNDINGGEKFHLDKKEPFVKPIRQFFEDIDDVSYEIVDVDSTSNDPKKFDINNTIFRTISKINPDRIIEDLVKQEKEGINPTLFSNKDGESVIVSFILLKDGDWRNEVKQSIIQANSMLSNLNFFKEAQEYLFFIYENSKSTKASCAIFVTPTTINDFLKLTTDYSNIKKYNVQDVLNACSEFTNDVFRVIEPIVPSSSKITQLFGPDDFKYNYITINPLYSRYIDSIRISANLAAVSTIKL